MEYEWESEITQDLLDEIDAMLPEGIFLTGIAVFNDESVEGALIKRDDQPVSLAGADIWKDVNGDAVRHYESAVAKWLDELGKLRRIQ